MFKLKFNIGRGLHTVIKFYSPSKFFILASHNHVRLGAMGRSCFTILNFVVFFKNNEAFFLKDHIVDYLLESR